MITDKTYELISKKVNDIMAIMVP
jgi:hypothetical protein